MIYFSKQNHQKEEIFGTGSVRVLEVHSKWPIRQYKYEAGLPNHRICLQVLKARNLTEHSSWVG